MAERLPVVSRRLEKAFNQFVTLREVVITATDQVESLRGIHNFGRKTQRELWILLEKLAEGGTDCLHYGDHGKRPSSIDDLVTNLLQTLSEKDERIFRRRYMDGATLGQIGMEDNVSGHAIRIRINRILRTARARTGAAAQELIAPLIKAMKESGGLLHRDLARRLASTENLYSICLVAQIAGLMSASGAGNF